MGTNYYIHANFCDKCERYDKIHLGKSSAGWRFLVQIQQPYYGDTETELIKFLMDNDGDIWDEYGKNISFDDLRDKIQAKKDDESHLDSKQDGDIDFMDGEFS